MHTTYISREDREYIENKYHNTKLPFDGFCHRAYHGHSYNPDTGLTDAQIEAGLQELVERVKNEPHNLIKAKAVAFVLDNTRIEISPQDYFPGIYSCGRLIDKYTLNVWQKEAEDAVGVGNRDQLEATGCAYISLDFDHTVPDFDSLTALGFPGILDRAVKSYKNLLETKTVTKKQEDFFSSLKIEYEAILRLTERLYRYALTRKGPKIEMIAASLHNLMVGPPQNTYDVLMLIYIYYMVSEGVDHYQVRALGYGLDGTLYPFFRTDIENGTFTKEEIAEFIAHFLMQFSAMGNYWGQPMYLGGTNLDGTTKVNELTELILEIYDKLEIYNPKLQIKVGTQTPKPFLLKALDMVRHGSNSMVFCNEETITKALMRQGATYEKAVDSVLKGCYEYVTKADTMCISFSTLNALKPMELVFFNGMDLKTGEKVGLETGEVSSFTSFEAFYNAYREQFDFLVKRMTDFLAVYEPYVNEINPSVLYSGTIPKCVEIMKDANDGGIKNVSSMWLNGLASAVDALMGVYYLVFESGTVTLGELKDALANNWEGYEALRRKVLNCKHKYGIGDKMADYYAKAIHQHYSALVSGLKNCHGGNYEYELHSARAFIEHGKLTAATPDGRKAGDETSKNASPSVGMDKNGVTAVINSATALDLSLADSGACLDIMLHPSSVLGEEGLEVFYGVLNTYMKKGGASVHFNVFSSDALRDAQKNPENYKNLQVRVCGWNVLWNNMSPEEQNAYITRAENIQR